MRVDFNVPMEKGKIKDNYKIIACLPTIRYLLRYKAKIILITHLGQPKNKEDKKFSTKPLANYLGSILGKKIKHVKAVIGFKAEEDIYKMKEGEILMLENLRFYKEEKKNDQKFARRLARLGDIYVNNAFGVCHRTHASVAAVKKYLPSYAGFLLAEEIKNLIKIANPKKPLVIVIGGAKITTKLPFLMKLAKKAEYILLGGGAANAFLCALGYEIGKSIGRTKNKKTLKEINKYYKQFGKEKNILPVDVAVGDCETRGRVRIKGVGKILKDEYIYDLGPQTIKIFAKFIKKAATIIWNGPLGLFENKKFQHSTLAIARVISSRSSGNCFGLAGGGETIEALHKTKMLPFIDWVSTGGGAMLAFLAGEKMPGLEGLVKNYRFGASMRFGKGKL